MTNSTHQIDAWYSDELVEPESGHILTTHIEAKFDCLKLSIEDHLWGIRTLIDLDQKALQRRT